MSRPVVFCFAAALVAAPCLALGVEGAQMIFEENVGQTDPSVAFVSRGSGYTMFLTDKAAVLGLLANGAESAVLSLEFEGASSKRQIVGLEETSSRSNYLLGNKPVDWHVGVPSYSRVRYGDLYDGIDAVFYGKDGEVEFDFVLAPGADVEDIRLGYRGSESVRIEDSGDLVIATRSGSLRQRRPRLYQETAQGRQEIQGRYKLVDGSTVGFEVSGYDGNRPLVIDPVLVYSTYLGGSSGEQPWAIALDSSGRVYVTGTTASIDYPLASPFQGTYGGSRVRMGDAFLTKLSADGSTVEYSTYLGGSGDDYGSGVVIDAEGAIYLTGQTTSADFPTANAAQPVLGGGPSYDPFDAFVAKLHPNGGSLIYSTYLGGSSVDFGFDIAVDPAGYAYVVGETRSSDFPILNALQPSCFDCGGGQGADAFLAKLGPDGGIVYSTFFGGTWIDKAHAVALGPAGHIYLTGMTLSSDFPVVDAYQPTYGGGGYWGDAFVARIAADGTSVLYSTYLGGSSEEIGLDIELSPAGDVAVGGVTRSVDFPTAAPAQPAHGDLGIFGDAFATVLSGDGSALVFSTFLGGSDTDFGFDVAVDPLGNVYLTGSTRSLDLPLADPVQGVFQGGAFFDYYGDGFVAKLSAAGALRYSTYLGGSGMDTGLAIATDHFGNSYVAGQTASIDFPVVRAFQGVFGGAGGSQGPYLSPFDGFVVKIGPDVIQIGDCETDVDDAALDDGTALSEEIAICAADAENHGAFVSCVARVTNKFKKEGLLSGNDKAKIIGCAS